MTAPYYQDEWVTLYHGDCREVLPSLSADVLITDPPYGVGLTTKTSDYRLKASTLYADDPETIRALIAEAVPLALSRTTRGLIFCGARMLFAYPEPASVGVVFTPNGAGQCPWGFQVGHPILFYGRDPYLEDGKGSRPNGFRTEQPNREVIDHPCPKPLAWMTWAVNRASRLGETVLDPFAGSGTTLIAAKKDGRRSIGVEISETYCEIIVKRLGQGVLDFGKVADESSSPQEALCEF